MQKLPPGDTVALIIVPGNRQGDVCYRHKGVTGKQSHDMFKALQKGIKLSQGKPDSRVADVLELLKANIAAEAAVAGTVDQCEGQAVGWFASTLLW
jgi:hypothetical protein